jgi:hypothetical protein
MAADPIHQFQITKLLDFGQVNLPLIGKTDLAFTWLSSASSPSSPRG